MSYHASDSSAKAKQAVLDEHDKAKKLCLGAVRHSSTGLKIREPLNTGNLSDFSSDEEPVLNQLATTFPAFSTGTLVRVLEQGESSKGKKRSYDSARYANLTTEQRKARQDRDRARSYNIVKLVVWDKLVTDNVSTWEKLAEERAIIVATMLCAKRIDRGLHTTDFSRIHFDPNIAAARELRKRINNDFPGPTPP